ncbi:hypothetical protein GCM10010214_54110 [Streptomyces abikoensis]|nr:hypothetical protein GCM10010214_54110 [Streptomyces abikoensis]
MIRRARRTSAVRDSAFAAAGFSAGFPIDFSTDFSTGDLFVFVDFVFFAAGRSPTAESRAALTLPAPLPCALTGVLDTRPD